MSLQRAGSRSTRKLSNPRDKESIETTPVKKKLVLDNEELSLLE